MKKPQMYTDLKFIYEKLGDVIECFESRLNEKQPVKKVLFKIGSYEHREHLKRMGEKGREVRKKNYEAKLRAEQEAKLRAEQEAKLRAEQEAKLRAEQEAKLRAKLIEDTKKAQDEYNQEMKKLEGKKDEDLDVKEIISKTKCLYISKYRGKDQSTVKVQRNIERKNKKCEYVLIFKKEDILVAKDLALFISKLPIEKFLKLAKTKNLEDAGIDAALLTAVREARKKMPKRQKHNLPKFMSKTKTGWYIKITRNGFLFYRHFQQNEEKAARSLSLFLQSLSKKRVLALKTKTPEELGWEAPRD